MKRHIIQFMASSMVNIGNPATMKTGMTCYHFIKWMCTNTRSCIRSVQELSKYSDWVTGCMTGVRFPAGEEKGFLSLRHSCVQTGSGDHPASYPMGTGGSLPRDKEAEALC